jgi:hypothetical protein
LPEPTNGGFKNQEEFRNFVMQKQKSGKWSSELHSRPLKDRIQDYKGDTLADAFPLQFPFGFTGLAEDPVNANDKNRKKRYRGDVFRKYLMHRKPAFHTAMFILIIDNMLLKDKIFLQSKIQCNIKHSEYCRLGEKFGTMSSEQLIRAIGNVRHQHGRQHSAAPADKFLKSLRASCSNLPHTNEATEEARQTYFSMLMKFGLPAMFLTITPDDLRNFRIMVYSLVGKEGKYISAFGEQPDMTDAEILVDYQYRQAARVQFPGLCAVEYQRIVTNVIRNVFNWNVETQKSDGIGLFGTILGYALATEEQGRKTLHGHFLLFVKDWKRVLNVLQKPKHLDVCVDQATVSTYQKALSQGKTFYSNASSARLFGDFEQGKPLDTVPVFFHQPCSNKRTLRNTFMRCEVLPVPDQTILEMRHYELCHVHGGLVATCAKASCGQPFYIDNIIAKALQTHFSTPDVKFPFPDATKRLDRIVYEMQKDFKWWNEDGDETTRARRYFASNALVNVHLTKHTRRCFKKGALCYANLPDAVSNEIQIQYSSECDIWSDWTGRKEKRYMFSFKPQRKQEDAFTNTHNSTLTCLLGCNTNVLVGMNGKSVFYVTSYNAKSQQKEENLAYEHLANIMIKIIRKQVRQCNIA